MKSKTSLSLLLGMLILTGIFSCEKEKEEKPEPSETVKNYLAIKTKMGMFNGMNSNGEMSTMNGNSDQSRNFMAVIGISQFSSNSLEIESRGTEPGVSHGYPGDSIDVWEYYTCATVTETDNGDGTFTTVYDYGDGCDEYGSLFSGKMTYIWSNEGNNYYSMVIYDNYYSYGTKMNGFSEYSFTSDGNSYYGYATKEITDDTVYAPDVFFNWSGTSTAIEEMTIIFDNGESYAYSSDYSNKWDSVSFTLLTGEYNFKNEAEGYEYNYLVTKPLFTDYRCSETWVPVSGIESIYYKESGLSAHFTLDYGNGSCDNLGILTENGESSVVDFGEMIQMYNDGVVSDTDSSSGTRPGKGK
jgi:hypothetical protein